MIYHGDLITDRQNQSTSGAEEEGEEEDHATFQRIPRRYIGTHVVTVVRTQRYQRKMTVITVSQPDGVYLRKERLKVKC